MKAFELPTLFAETFKLRENMDEQVAFYHSPCTDGSCCAWVFNKKFPGAKLIPLDYGSLDMDQIRKESLGKHVYFLDCSLKYVQMAMLKGLAKRITVIDHHKSFKDDGILLMEEGVINCIFDIEKCGSKLVWEYCFDGVEYPLVVKYVDDRDRWVWSLRNSKTISAYISTVPDLISQFDSIEFDLINNFERVVVAGNAVLNYQSKTVVDLLKLAIDVKWTIFKIKCVNTSMLHSEVGEALAKLGRFGMTYFINAQGKYVFSLRSEGPVDVGIIAASHGGGGHRNAAGFTLDQWPIEFVRGE